MSTLPLPKALATRRLNSLDLERENFEKAQAASISKALTTQECAVKEKHIRSILIGTYQEKGAYTFWDFALKHPVQGNPIVAWKLCHVVHKVLREGHPRVLPMSMRYRQSFQDLGKLWGLLNDGYGRLILCYCNLILAKLQFHARNPKFPGNLSITNADLDDIGESDVNIFFQLACELLDYMEEVLSLQHAVFGSLDMARSNSMTNSGQCRLAPLIPCIQDSSQLYDYTVKVLFKLHASLPQDTLSGHRERFRHQFALLQQFYTNSANLQYFKHLIQVPSLPKHPPNFFVASDLNDHVSPVVILPSQGGSESPDLISQSDMTDTASIIDLIDTSSPQQEAPPLPPPVPIQQQQQNGDSINKDNIIEQMLREMQELRGEMHRLREDSDEQSERLRHACIALEEQLASERKRATVLEQEKEKLVVAASSNTENEERIAQAEKRARANEDKFHKMKDVYTKLREEHIGLLRTKADVERQLNAMQTSSSNTEAMNQRLAELSCQISELEAAKEASMKEEAERTQSALDAAHLDASKRQHDLLKALLTAFLSDAESIVDSGISELDMSHASGSPDMLLQSCEITGSCLQRFVHALAAFRNNISGETGLSLSSSIHPLAHRVYQLLQHSKGTANASVNIDKANELIATARNFAQTVVEMYRSAKAGGTASAMGDQCNTLLLSLTKLGESLLEDRAKESNNPELSHMLEEELAQMDAAIEEAAKRIGELLDSSRAKTEGVRLEVNERILDACRSLMDNIRVLIRASRALQEEIVAQRGGGCRSTFYSRNHRWTEGLISAAKVVGIGAKFLVEAADRVLDGAAGAKLEDLVVASQEIAGATAQLLVASKVKADRESERLKDLSKASKGVSEATAQVVATVRSCAKVIDDADVLDLNKMTLHQAKRMEMESQVRVLELESSLDKERLKLASLRRRHYHLGGAAEGWDTTAKNNGK